MPKKEFIHDNSDTTQNSKQLAILKQNFPNCFDKNGNFIIHKMEEIVGNAGLELSKESYSLNWLGKSYARLLANENPRTLLKEDKVHNAKEANQSSQNLLIKGDNLEVLKHLSNAYSESIKMIYIDPPYNTGGDGFVYNDDRKFSKEELSRLAGIEIDEAKRILEFTSSKSNSHSAWLTFMYPRLYVARELLREDGVIFISIDENEVAQLKLLCDEVFGEENFVGEIIWQKRKGGGNDSLFLAVDHEYILTYTKSSEYEHEKWRVPYEEKHLKRYREKDDKGNYYWDTLHRGGLNSPIIYDVRCPDGTVIKDGTWQVSQKTFDEKIKRDEIKVVQNSDKFWNVHHKIYQSSGRVFRSIFTEYTNTNSANEIKDLFKVNKLFDTPKPIGLLNTLIGLINLDNNDIILDFFAGSGTTAHAVMALNAQDGGNRKFITVQIPEKTDEKSEAFKAGYETIFDITKARIEKASEKLNDKSGFKIYETTPIFDGYLDDIEELNSETTLFNGNALNSEEIDILLTTWKAHDGMLLTDSLEVLMLGEYTAHYGANTLYFMNEGFNIEALQAFIEKLDNDKTFEPSKLVIFGYNFDSKHQRELKEALNNYKNKKSIEFDMVVRY